MTTFVPTILVVAI